MGCGNDDGEETTDPDSFAGPSGSELPDPRSDPGEGWSYSGRTGPEHWAELRPIFGACDGDEQSPIDLSAEGGSRPIEIDFHYQPATGTEDNNGHGVEVVLEHAGGITTDGEDYALQNYHFHLPSEHRIEGRAFDAEMHVVHLTPNSGIAVIAAFVEVGEENEALADALSDVPLQAGEERPLEAELDPLDLLPGRGEATAYRYDGSLTVPPCTEGVLWTVYEEPIEISREQLANLAEAFDDDARPLQPLNGREIVRGPVE